MLQVNQRFVLDMCAFPTLLLYLLHGSFIRMSKLGEINASRPLYIWKGVIPSYSLVSKFSDGRHRLEINSEHLEKVDVANVATTEATKEEHQTGDLNPFNCFYWSAAAYREHMITFEQDKSARINYSVLTGCLRLDRSENDHKRIQLLSVLWLPTSIPRENSSVKQKS